MFNVNHELIALLVLDTVLIGHLATNKEVKFINLDVSA